MQEMTMVERVAREIHAADDMEESYEEMKIFFDTLARAAIEAMREPSLMMQSSALPYVNRQHQTRSVWRAMIDAALSE